MVATIQKWGNSHGIRLPKPMLDSVGLQINDKVELIQGPDSITLHKVLKPAHRTIEERLTSFFGKPLNEIPPLADEEISWGPAQGGEVW